MVIETFRNGPELVYERFHEHGRMLPAGLVYVDSWVDATDATRCFQLMETDDPTTLGEWTSRWDDLVAFEIVPVTGSTEAAARAAGGEDRRRHG
jgi:hypothetical protein